LDSSLVATTIGALAALLGSFGATFFAQWLAQKQDTEKKYKEKIEEMQELAIQVKSWVEFETYQWWLEYEHNSDREKNTLECPIDRLTMLADRYEPSLNKSILEIGKEISYIKNGDLDMFEQGLTVQGYYDVIKGCYDRYNTAYNTMNSIFKQINMKSSKKGVVKLTTPTDNSLYSFQ